MGWVRNRSPENWPGVYQPLVQTEVEHTVILSISANFKRPHMTSDVYEASTSETSAKSILSLMH